MSLITSDGSFIGTAVSSLGNMPNGTWFSSLNDESDYIKLDFDRINQQNYALCLNVKTGKAKCFDASLKPKTQHAGTFSFISRIGVTLPEGVELASSIFASVSDGEIFDTGVNGGKLCMKISLFDENENEIIPEQGTAWSICFCDMTLEEKNIGDEIESYGNDSIVSYRLQ